MKSIFFFIAFCSLTTALQAQAPTICLFYDQAGNRINRVTCCTACLVGEGNDENTVQEAAVARGEATETLAPLSGQIVPNPNDGHFEVALSRVPEDALFQVFSAGGELILEQKAVSERQEFHLQDVPSGNYYMVLKSEGQLLGQWIILKN